VSIENHRPISLTEFNGLYDRGDADTVPFDHDFDNLNTIFTNKGEKTREGFALDFTLASVRRFHIYKIEGQADRLLILDNTGKLFDSTDLVTPILNIATMIDFSVATFFDRAYITPHNRVTGITAEKVYVYNGSGLARPAAGTPPSGFTITAVESAAAGNVEVGLHLFSVIFETDTGFFTAPGPEIFTSHTVANADKKVDLSGVAIGPAGTIARHILVTKILIDYDGNQAGVSLFFVPNGKINDNVATIITVNFFDSSLVTTADYLVNNLSIIPAGVGIH